jgi:pimeloyl-ACP methyl ester carboxylesterase
MIGSCLIAIVVFVILTPSAKADIIENGNAEGPAIVFVPGLASHGDLWAPWVKKYQASHRVFVVTAPGFAGETPRSEDVPFLKATVDEIANHLKSKKIEGAVFVGHSIGGLMSVMTANEYPELVEKVLVVDSLPYLGAMFMPGLAHDQVVARANAMQAQMANTPRDAYLAQQRAGIGIQSKTQVFLPTLLKWGETSDQRTVAKAFGEALRTDYRDNLKGINAEILVLAAHSAEMPFTKEAAHSLYSAQYGNLPNGRVEVIEDSFHFIMIDQPDVFGAKLDTFLK